MSVKRRLRALESVEAGGIAEHARALYQILGWSDGIHTPSRDADAGRLAQVWHLRQQAIQQGVEWAGAETGGTARGWKTNERQRTALATAGLVTITQRPGTPLLKLKPQVEHDLRRALGLETVAKIDAEIFLAELDHAAESGEHWTRPGGWVSETHLSGTTYAENPSSTAYDPLAWLLLPLISFGVVESLTSTIGALFYRRVQGATLPEVDDDRELPELPEGMDDIYLDGVDAAREAMRRVRTTSELAIPLSATR